MRTFEIQITPQEKNFCLSMQIGRGNQFATPGGYTQCGAMRSLPTAARETEPSRDARQSWRKTEWNVRIVSMTPSMIF